jgi:hypothetical protein
VKAQQKILFLNPVMVRRPLLLTIEIPVPLTLMMVLIHPCKLLGLPSPLLLEEEMMEAARLLEFRVSITGTKVLNRIILSHQAPHSGIVSSQSLIRDRYKGMTYKMWQ